MVSHTSDHVHPATTLHVVKHPLQHLAERGASFDNENIMEHFALIYCGMSHF